MRTVTVFGVFAAALAVACSSTSTSGSGLADPVALRPLPDAEAEQLRADGTWSTEDIDRPTIINFWASWCAVCIDEMPDLQAIANRTGDSAQFIGVARQSPVDDLLQLADDTGVSYLLVNDTDDVLFRSLGLMAMPTTLFVDASGRPVHRHNGIISQDQLVDAIETHLDVDVVE